MLNDYHYPVGAHVIGYVIVVIILLPLPIMFGLAVRSTGFNKQVDLNFFSSLGQ